MLSEKTLAGIYVPVATPFLPNEQLDLSAYRRYLDHLLGYDIHGVVVGGTTGESPTITWEETAALVRETRDAMAGQRPIPIIVGTGTNSTSSTVQRTEWAGQIGADAVLVVTPYYSRPSEEGILEHYRRVARTGVPVIAYEIPSRTGVRLSADTMLRILELDGVIGLKDSSGSLELIRELSRFETKPILCGEDALFYSMLCQGARGGVLASANLRTEKFLEVYRKAEEGDYPSAKRKFDELLPLIGDLFRESNPSPLKWLLAQQGLLSSDAVRLPMSPITSELRARLSRYLSE